MTDAPKKVTDQPKENKGSVTTRSRIMAALKKRNWAKRLESPSGAPIVEELDLSLACDLATRKYLIIERLKELGLYSPNLLFRGFDGARIEILKRTGTDEPTEGRAVSCSRENELTDLADEKTEIEIALDHDEPGLSVYDGNKLYLEVFNTYIPKKGKTLKEALLAIFLLRY